MQTVAVIILMEIVVTAQLLPGVRREVNWRAIAPMGIAAALFMPAGSWLLVTLDPDLFARFVALVVLAFSIVLMMGWRHRRREEGLAERRGRRVLRGVDGGDEPRQSARHGLPPVRRGQCAATNRANFTGYFAVTLIALVAMMAASGLIDRNALVTAAILLPVFMAGAFVGSRLFRKSSEALYRRVALALLLCVGVYGLLR